MSDLYFPAARGSLPIPDETRRRVLERARGRCEDCGETCPLELHHLHYQTVGKEKPFDLDALCRECHRRRHVDLNGDWWNDPEEKADYWRNFFESD